MSRRPPNDSARLLRLLLPMRWFLAAGWLRAAAEKVIDPQWWTGAALTDFLTTQRPAMFDGFPVVVDYLIAPAAVPIAWIVVHAQVAIGVCLLLGYRLTGALWAGIVLNTTFVLSGAVNPSAFYLIMQLVLLLAVAAPTRPTTALRRAGAWATVAVLVTPFIDTLAPHAVIDDPAAMLAMIAALAAVGSLCLSTVPVDVWAATLIRGGQRVASGRSSEPLARIPE